MILSEIISERSDLNMIRRHCSYIGDDRVVVRDTGATVIFPVENETLTERLLSDFGENGQDFSYREYDRALDSAWLSPRRVGMILMRLKYPVGLTGQQKQYLREKISAEMDKVLKRIAAENCTEDLELLCELGFFTADSVDHAISALREAGAHEMMVQLMNWKRENITAVFDFSL